MQTDSVGRADSWQDTLSLLLSGRSLRMLLLGFSSGLPILLVFSTLSVWLIKAGVQRDVVTFFSWAGIAYGFKFVWSPLIDRIPCPIWHSVLATAGHGCWFRSCASWRQSCSLQPLTRRRRSCGPQLAQSP